MHLATDIGVSTRGSPDNLLLTIRTGRHDAGQSQCLGRDASNCDSAMLEEPRVYEGYVITCAQTPWRVHDGIAVLLRPVGAEV